MIKGFNGDNYLQTAHWYNFKRKYAYRYQPICYLCQKDGELELCRITEERLYYERFTDVVYLCGKCRKAVFANTKRGRQIRAWIDPVKRPAIKKLSMLKLERLTQKSERQARRA